MARLRDSTGVSALGLLLALAIFLALAWLVLNRTIAPGGEVADTAPGPALDASRQRRTLADMRAIVRANDLMRVDAGRWAASLDELVSGGHLVRVPERDGWGNVWDYTVDGSDYTLVSRGSDGRPGPAPPADWSGAPYEPDLVLHNGQVTQAPSGR